VTGSCLMSAAIGNRSSLHYPTRILSKALTLLSKPTYCFFHAAGMATPLAANGKVACHRHYYSYSPSMPAQRPAEVLGTPTHAQLVYYIEQLTPYPLLGIDAA